MFYDICYFISVMNRFAAEVKEALKEAGIALSDITTTCLIGGW